MVMLAGVLIALAPRAVGSDEHPIRLAFDGNCAFTNDRNKAMEGGNKPFGTTAETFQAADIAMVNLESVLAPASSPAHEHRPGAPILRGHPRLQKF